MIFKSIKEKIKKERGQAALETLAVLMLFFFVTGFFLLSVFFLLGRINAQATIAEATKEVASLGCVPELADNDGGVYLYNDDYLSGLFSVWGAEIQGTIEWQYRSLGSGYTDLPSCTDVFDPTITNPVDPAPSGSLVRGSAVYSQGLPIFSGDSSISFEAVSSSLEEGG